MSNLMVEAALPITLDGSDTAYFSIATAAANLFTGTAPLDWLGWPGMQDLGTHWICGYQRREAHQTPGIGNRFSMHFSDDGGLTWTDENKYLDGNDVSGLPAGMGTCYFISAPNGDVLFLQGTWVDTVYRSSNGGATWTSAASGISNADLRMQAGYGFTASGVIYVPMHKFASQPNNATPWDQEVWVSSDNGVSWSLRGTVPYAPGATGDEFSIINLNDTTLLAVCRDASNAKTYYNLSYDDAVTWTDRAEIADMGIMQMLRMRKFAGGIMGFGREGTKTAGGVRTTIWYTLDGITWGKKLQLDQAFNDAGYCDVLQRDDGKYYCMTYGGTDATANIRHLVFEIVG